MKDYSLFTSSHLAQRQNKIVQEVDTIGITVRDMEQAIAISDTETSRQFYRASPLRQRAEGRGHKGLARM